MDVPVFVNLWDDYADGDATHAYIENNRDMSADDQATILRQLNAYLNTNCSKQLVGVTTDLKVENGRARLYFHNLTHEQRDGIMRSVGSDVMLPFAPLKFVSES